MNFKAIPEFYPMRISIILLWFFLLTFQGGCGGTIDNAALNEIFDQVIEPPKRYATLDECLNHYQDWTAPLLIKQEIKDLACDFFQKNLDFSYQHHDDARFKKQWDEESLDGYHGDEMDDKSQHYNFIALDYSGIDVKGMTKCEKYIACDNFFKAHDQWLIESGKECAGNGIYPQQHRCFVHLDTHGLRPGEKCGRRWSRINGRYVSIEKGRAWLAKRVASCLFKDYVHQGACRFTLKELAIQCAIKHENSEGWQEKTKSCIEDAKRKAQRKLGCRY